ncbi:hypothetical protein [Prescottella agglutinans]|uniref:hypothetical protein n=1 Tax=Prescottella agglutinans TaxID=1644129 RepID=UPI00247477A2|nr:hypothetical protein [Prescottella agglutinans]
MLADLGISDGEVGMRLSLESEESTTWFRYELMLAPELETQCVLVSTPSDMFG